MSYQLQFEIQEPIRDVETMAAGSSIRRLNFLRKRYGHGRWLKKKGTARVRLADGTIKKAEVHWYEAHGIGKRLIKIKRYLD